MSVIVQVMECRHASLSESNHRVGKENTIRWPYGVRSMKLCFLCDARGIGINVNGRMAMDVCSHVGDILHTYIHLGGLDRWMGVPDIKWSVYLVYLAGTWG